MIWADVMWDMEGSSENRSQIYGAENVRKTEEPEIIFMNLEWKGKMDLEEEVVPRDGQWSFCL